MLACFNLNAGGFSCEKLDILFLSNMEVYLVIEYIHLTCVLAVRLPLISHRQYTGRDSKMKFKTPENYKGELHNECVTQPAEIEPATDITLKQLVV